MVEEDGDGLIEWTSGWACRSLWMGAGGGPFPIYISIFLFNDHVHHLFDVWATEKCLNIIFYLGENFLFIFYLFICWIMGRESVTNKYDNI